MGLFWCIELPLVQRKEERKLWSSVALQNSPSVLRVAENSGTPPFANAEGSVFRLVTCVLSLLAQLELNAGPLGYALEKVHLNYPMLSPGLADQILLYSMIGLQSKRSRGKTELAQYATLLQQ